MKRLAWLCATLFLLAGCSTAAPSKAAPQDPAPAPVAAAVPTEQQMCLKPDDATGVFIDLFKPLGGDSAFRTRPGWSVARLAQNLSGAVIFPRAVDPGSVRISVAPATVWKGTLTPTNQDFIVGFDFSANGQHTGFAEPGWITITVDGARDTAGKAFSSKPMLLKVYGYTMAMQDRYPYLAKCWASLVVPHEGGH